MKVPSLDVIHGWRNTIHGWLSHPWMPSMDEDDGWRTWTQPSSIWFLVKIVCITLFKWEFLSNYCNSSEKLIVESSMAYVLGAGEMSSVDVIHGWRNVIHGWIDAIHWGRNVIRGCHPWMERCHPWMEKCHPWMEKCHPWMSSMDGEMSSMDGSVIRGCHPWMTSMDEDDGWRTRTQPVSSANITEIQPLFVGLFFRSFTTGEFQSSIYCYTAFCCRSDMRCI